MSTTRFPIPQGTLDMLILQILSLEPAHGYGIAQRLQQISREAVQVNQGSLYPALHRLEQKGWLTSEWRQSETGREAKFYALTKAGRKQLAVEKATWDRLTDAVQLIFNEGRAEAMAPTPQPAALAAPPSGTGPRSRAAVSRRSPHRRSAPVRS